MTATDTYLGLRAFVDELVRCGVEHACTSPGSRSTPLVLSLVRDGRLRCTSHIDERSGSFYGLGTAKATGRPAVLACTSGTAAANYAPAVIEAYEARVPLLVLTADRPWELRDVGAGQTIDQVKLYGRAAKWFLEVDEAEATPDRMRFMRRLACRAVWTAVRGRPGPVHLNFPLREPLVLDGDLPREPGGGGRSDGRAWTEHYEPAPAAADLQLEARRPVIVAGRMERPGDGDAVAAFAARARWPLLADPLSGARRGDAAIAHYDALLRIPNWGEGFAPDLVVRIGDLPTSKPLRQWLTELPRVRQVALDASGAWQDPDAAVDEIHPAGPEALRAEPVDGRWLDGWRRADGVARSVMGRALGGGLSEPAVAVRTAAALGPQDTLVVASSMPVRDLETFAVTRARVLSNRGANGIDGTVSTALGVAAATSGRTVLLTGDVALLHDANGLIAARRGGTDLVIVVVNNDGGGIFGFLPVAGEDGYEEHIATPHGVDLAQLAETYGWTHTRPETPAEFDEALSTNQVGNVIEVRTDRAANVQLHRGIWAAIAKAVAEDT
jgi:2-succinyl-5-enolpyruvyl-6-hydroxy-3-cyclohexene-1-carboxylate synthase